MIQEQIQQVLEHSPYELTDKEKEKALLPLIKQQLETAQKNPYIKSFFEKQNMSVDNITSLEQVPPMPVQMFKYYDLSFSDDIARVIKSSGTTTQVRSRVPLSKNTMLNQTKALAHILSHYLGPKRASFIVIDAQTMNTNQEEIVARTAGIRGLSLYAKKIYYVLKEVDGKLELDEEVIQQLQQEQDPCYAFGFTFIIWSQFVKKMKEKNLTLPQCTIFHSGGWKKLANEQVSKEQFEQELAKVCNTTPDKILNFYGMAEQTGIIFVENNNGLFTVPSYAQVIIRDPQTLKEQPVGKEGLIEVMSVLSDSYYAQAILTEDIGVVEAVDQGKEQGRQFRFVRRVDKAEVRGCGDTFREK